MNHIGKVVGLKESPCKREFFEGEETLLYEIRDKFINRKSSRFAILYPDLHSRFLKANHKSQTKNCKL
jgi:hypothetical protein